jgi:hypothetical protein
VLALLLEQVVGGGAECCGAFALGLGPRDFKRQQRDPVVELGDRQFVEVLAGQFGKQVGLALGKIGFIEHDGNR